MFQYRIREINPLTNTVIQLLLTPLDAAGDPKAGKLMQYSAGQYIEIHTQDGKHAPFSIANAPLGSQQIECHIRHHSHNKFTENLLNEIRETGVINFTGPLGHCVYHNEITRPTLFLASGTGFAPMKALIEEALTAGHDHLMHLYWGAKHQNDLYLCQLPEQWAYTMPNFSYSPVLDPEVVADKVIADHKSAKQQLKDFVVYAAGSYEFVKHCYEQLVANGLIAKNFYSDML